MTAASSAPKVGRITTAILTSAHRDGHITTVIWTSDRKVRTPSCNPRGSARGVRHIAMVIMPSGRKVGTPSRNPRVSARRVDHITTVIVPPGREVGAHARNPGNGPGDPGCRPQARQAAGAGARPLAGAERTPAGNRDAGRGSHNTYDRKPPAKVPRSDRTKRRRRQRRRAGNRRVRSCAHNGKRLLFGHQS